MVTGCLFSLPQWWCSIQKTDERLQFDFLGWRMVPSFYVNLPMCVSTRMYIMWVYLSNFCLFSYLLLLLICRFKHFVAIILLMLKCWRLNVENFPSWLLSCLEEVLRDYHCFLVFWHDIVLADFDVSSSRLDASILQGPLILLNRKWHFSFTGQW